MCFSASASFTASAILIPAGIYCIKKASECARPYWAIGLLPLVFGIQQLFEGFIWLAQGTADDSRLPALGFLFFSHLFWLFWIPFSCYFLETRSLRRKVFLGFAVLGLLHGLIMYIPFVLNTNWFKVELMKHSIVYATRLLYDDFVPRIAVRGLYAVIVLVPLLFSSDRNVKIFGVIILLSVVLSTIFFGYAFISVWCYFAAILSVYILFMILRLCKTAN